jgi:hypothetical protein
LRLGDNVVWQWTNWPIMPDSQRPCGEQPGAGRPCVYLRFAPHAPLARAQAGLEIITVDPGSGFDVFSAVSIA